MNNGRDGVLAVDVGGGTQDILCWFSGQLPENAFKMVLPSPTILVARQLEKLRQAGQDVVLVGVTMGGGPCTRAVQQLLESGRRVYAVKEAALTIHDDLDKVRSMGVEVVENPPDGIAQVTFQDLDLKRLNRAFGLFHISLPSTVAVAVQDHGFSPKESNRRFRFRYWKEFLEDGGDLKKLATSAPPPYMTRMQAVRKTAGDAVVLDTGIAAILGALMDSRGRRWNEEGLTVVNVGNFHTLAALVKRGKIYALYEHHSGLLNPEKFHRHIEAFRQGRLSHQEVFDDNGHGCAYGKHPLEGRFDRLLVTGPRRRALFRDERCFAAPFGDMMLSGCFGLLQAAAWTRGLSLPLEFGASHPTESPSE